MEMLVCVSQVTSGNRNVLVYRVENLISTEKYLQYVDFEEHVGTYKGACKAWREKAEAYKLNIEGLDFFFFANLHMKKRRYSSERCKLPDLQDTKDY